MEKNEMNREMSEQVMENEQKPVKDLEMHVEAPIGNMNVSVNAQGVKTEVQETDAESAQQVKAEVQEMDTESAQQEIVGDNPPKSGAEQFAGLPIEALICGPIVAAAKGQRDLTAVYVDTIMKLAYKDQDSGKEQNDKRETNTLDFTIKRPVNKPDGTVETQDCEISAPLISLVPVPAFTMDELTVDFNMEVKNSDLQTDTSSMSASTSANYKSWFGLSANITGSVSSDSSHKRETDSTATYKIHARAVQQPPSEGMAKLTSLFAQAMEPIPKSTSQS